MPRTGRRCVSHETGPAIGADGRDPDGAGNARESQEKPALVTRHTLRESQNRLNVLLAEDNAVNQLVALRLLERCGHTVTVAATARRRWRPGKRAPSTRS